MKSIRFALPSAVFCSLLSGALAFAATVTGTVTDKTTGKPSAGDKVELVDVQAGMSAVATATTDSKGKYSLKEPGNGPYLVRVTHQGTPYFVAAPEGNTPADVPVYDAAPHVDGISIEADVMEIEAEASQLHVTERYFIHNTSRPPQTQYNPAHGFEVVLPEGATVDGTAARRPTGLPTSTRLKPGNGKNHFQFDFPIQPDEGDKDTLFQISYHMPYNGKAAFRPDVTLPADNVAVLLPMSIKFEGSGFQSIKEDPGIQTFLAKNVKPGAGLEFAISGTGSMPREQQGQQPAAGGAEGGAGARPGGGIGEPINTPDPLTKYKWWILGGLGVLLAAAAGFLLRKPEGAPAVAGGAPSPATAPPARHVTSHPSPEGVHSYIHTPAPPHGDHNATLLSVLKEELFTLESEKLSGSLSQADYLEQKNALETVLKRALKR